MLRDLPVEVLSLKDFPGVPEVEEDGSTFRDNALKKAREVSRHISETVLADDSGLEVDSLGGQPGIHSARYAGPEATDGANAVFDGTSAVMLSAETAIGHDPVLVVATMARIAGRADQRFDYDGWAERLKHRHVTEAAGLDAKVTDTMTMAAWRAAMDMHANAIICITRSGFTARAIARFRPEAKILAYSPDPRTVHQLSMSWGATPLRSDAHGRFSEMTDWAVADATSKGLLRSGDVVVVVAGSREGAEAADTMRLVRVR